jgi:hypothetical protein
MLGTCRGRATAIAQLGVEARNVLRPEFAYALAIERFLRMGDRRAIGTDRRRLALKRGDPAIRPFNEPDRWSWPIRTVFDCGLELMQGNFSALAIPSDGLLVSLLAHTDDHVIEGTLRAGTPIRCSFERGPSMPQSARPCVVRVEAGH